MTLSCTEDDITTSPDPRPSPLHIHAPADLQETSDQRAAHVAAPKSRSRCRPQSRKSAEVSSSVFVRDRDDATTAVLAAGRTSAVRRDAGAALRALAECGRDQGVVRPATVTFRARGTSLGNWHGGCSYREIFLVRMAAGAGLTVEVRAAAGTQAATFFRAVD